MKLTKKGVITTKEKQIKKHCTQFTSKDNKRIEEIRQKILNKNSDSRFAGHLKRKKLPITQEAIRKCFEAGQVIEVNYNTDTGDKRLLFRGVEKINLQGVDYNLCLVYSIVDNIIVTAYYNKANDIHHSINMDRYYNHSIFKFEF